MFVRIRHTTHYRYDRPVFFEPMTLRLTPRQDATQQLREHHIALRPEPEGSTSTIEQDGTDALAVWFSGMHAQLEIVTTSLVETRRENPFDYLITHEPAQRLPASYPSPWLPLLEPYLHADPPGAEVQSWAAGLAADAQQSTVDFLQKLTAHVHGEFRLVERLDGEPYTPDTTLEKREGACRDLAVLFIAACRSQGLATRFVSGYSIHGADATEHELHAWAEVYLPGGGWRGFDPSLGLAVADGHVAVASGPDHVLAAPITGSFRGTEATATLSYDIELKASETPED